MTEFLTMEPALPSRVVPKCALCVVFDQPRRRIPVKSQYIENAGSCQISLLANSLLKLTRFSGDQHNRPRKSQWNSQDPVDRQCHFKSISCLWSLFTAKIFGNLWRGASSTGKQFQPGQRFWNRWILSPGSCRQICYRGG